MTTDEAGLVERLEDEAGALERAAWARPDGGQDACIAANLAREAADRIVSLEAALEQAGAALESIPGRHPIPRSSKGKTSAFEAVNRGSNPRRGTSYCGVGQAE